MVRVEMLCKVKAGGHVLELNDNEAGSTCYFFIQSTLYLWKDQRM